MAVAVVGGLGCVRGVRVGVRGGSSYWEEEVVEVEGGGRRRRWCKEQHRHMRGHEQADLWRPRHAPEESGEPTRGRET